MADVPAWLAAARLQADQPPRSSREPLHVDGAVVGSVEPALAQRWVEARLPVRRAGAGWHVDASAPAGSGETGADAAFAAIARWLHDAGLAGRWRDERLAVTDAGGRMLGTVERSAVRAFGITTFAVHLIACDGDGRAWVQKRALDKATDPGLWDTTMGGQVAAGESTQTALVRETMEEAGLDVGALLALQPAPRITFRRPVEEGWLVE
ncbi:MAG: NUDIX domain-containing protein, partial [Caldimonas sp.]